MYETFAMLTSMLALSLITLIIILKGDDKLVY